jgi:2-polyprenyl-6-methoxyphenol hydroxylase-like FAD-dependent oxidoreductase
MPFDCIIIGGRPSGASLAARLGALGLRVLLLERAAMPSLPAASSPAINPAAMELLDEIGANERAYALNTPRIPRWVLACRDKWAISFPMAHRAGRAYGYAIDRARFDGELWRVAAQTPNVTARAQSPVSELLWEGERVIGARVKAESIHAPLVIGADGRFSLVARQTRAPVYAVRPARPTSIYYAYWRGVRPLADGVPAFHMIDSRDGFGLLIMESADDTAAVTIEGQAAILDGNPGQIAAFYDDILSQARYLAPRLAPAQRVTEVRGMKRIGNFYRQAGGSGWALVGDAVHQKDPLDGQGIYDALFTAKALSAALEPWQGGALTWAQAIAQYTAAIQAETRGMYHATLQRVQREIYNRYPNWLIHALAQDPDYQRGFALLHTRQVSPERWLPTSVALRALVNGLKRSFRKTQRTF